MKDHLGVFAAALIVTMVITIIKIFSVPTQEVVLRYVKHTNRTKYIKTFEDEVKYVNYISYALEDIEKKDKNLIKLFLNSSIEHDLMYNVIDPAYEKSYILDTNDINIVGKPFLPYYQYSVDNKINPPLEFNEYKVDIKWSIKEYSVTKENENEFWYRNGYDYYDVTVESINGITFNLFIREDDFNVEIIENKSTVTFSKGYFADYKYTLDSYEYNEILECALSYEICRGMMRSPSIKIK